MAVFFANLYCGKKLTVDFMHFLIAYAGILGLHNEYLRLVNRIYDVEDPIIEVREPHFWR